MRPITERIPKALLTVAGRPFVDHQIEWLAAHGVSEVILSVGYLGEMIEAHVGSGARLGVPVRYVHEGSTLRGTGGALRLAYERGVLAESFLVTYGDSFLPVDFGQIGAAFVGGEHPALMTVFKNDGQWDKSNVIFDPATGLIDLYDKTNLLRPAHDFDYIDYGLSVFRRDTIVREIRPNVTHDLAQVFHLLSVRGQLAGFEVSQRFYEIGSPQGLADLEARFAGT